ncbi:MAG: tRNA pseudouridine(13) synthase TruD [candidate division FCPU426 bacterium]
MKKLKIKCRPEDFTVEELASLPLAERGRFAVYWLSKRGWNTADALQRIAKASGVPYDRFAYGGKKDRHGLTGQWVTVEDRRSCSVSEPHYTFELRGYSDQPMGPQWIQGNRFAVTVRHLTSGDVRRALAELETTADAGFVNYFDDQRFGGFDRELGSPAERLLRGERSEALKIFTAGIHTEDTKAAKERKLKLREAWGDWPACLALAQTRWEREIFGLLARQPQDVDVALQRLSRETASLAVSAFQSLVWNETMRRWLSRRGWGERHYTGKAGEYVFYGALAPEDCSFLLGLDVPLADARAAMPDAELGRIYADVLAERRLAPPDFGRFPLRQAYFKSAPRLAAVKPEAVSSETLADELYPRHKALRLAFTLPRGCYATMLLKRLFAAPVRKD